MSTPSLMHVEATTSLIFSASGHPTAPHVAARISRFAGGDVDIVRELAAALSPARLSGAASLPDPLPYTPAVAAAVAPAVEPLAKAGRRLLSICALSVTDRIDVALTAAGVDLGDLLDGPAGQLLVIADGRFRFVDERVRSSFAAMARRSAATIHGSLARALQARGAGALAVWHGALSGQRQLDAHALRALGRLAESLLSAGDTLAARTVAVELAARAPRAQRAPAELTAARAAIALGCLADAQQSLQRLATVDEGRDEQSVTALRAAIDSLRAGPTGDPDPRMRFVEQADALRPLAASAADRATMSAMAEISATWWTDPTAADTIQARSFLSAISARPDWPWRLDPGPLSPLFEALMRIQHGGFLLQANEMAAAATLIADLVERLPLTHVAGGVISSALRILDGRILGVGDGIRSSLAAIRPEHVIGYDVYGPPSGTLSASATRLASGSAARGATGSPHDRVPGLTAREHQVAALLLDGRSNREIGARLGISDRTVEVHLGKLFRKAGVSSRAQLIARLLR